MPDSAPLYALVAYVRNPVGEFVEELRRELHPEHPDWPAHITVVPQRYLQGSEEQAIQMVEEVCQNVPPFEIVMGDVETFAPITPTVFIRVAHAAYRVRELHDQLNRGALALDEPWPYMPHLTIVKLNDPEAAWRTAHLARTRWAAFPYSRRILLDQLTFVRAACDPNPNLPASGTPGGGLQWIDLAPIPLGRSLTQQTR